MHFKRGFSATANKFIGPYTVDNMRKNTGLLMPRLCSMSSISRHFVLFLIFYLSVGLSESSRQLRPHKFNPRPSVYTNEFAVEVPGGLEEANRIATKHGFINLGQVGSLDGYYIFTDKRIAKRSIRKTHRLQQRVHTLEREVVALEPLQVLKRVKRDAVSVLDRSPNDPSWDQMWYMHCGQPNETFCPISMRIVDAWSAGFTGEGVVVTILDDGLENRHADIARNYDPGASIDINSGDRDPTPRYDVSNENKHGTRCAGVVAAEKDNYICGVGVAHGAKIGGVRMLDGEVTDKVEARSLNFALEHIDIYSASWGPDDDGTTVEGPGILAKAAFKAGAKRGRNGRGAIYIWASGNGGQNKDSCSCDGYINNIYTIGMSSVSQYGYRPWYLEGCASTLATTYSSGEMYEGKVVTTDLHAACTHQHTGTSASAPMAAGVVALMLQANSNLTWRDVQHIIVRTSNSQGLRAHDWVVNGAGFNVSHVFGYGLLDAASLTHVAKRWREVPEHRECINPPQRLAKDIIMNRHIGLSMDTRACHRSASEIAYLEHVVLRLTLSHPRRGDLQIYLTSPSGTRSHILQRRDYDRSKVGFAEWEFMTTHHWGENPMGVWQLEVRDQPTRSRYSRDQRRRGVLRKWQLVFYGTATHPQPDFNFTNCDAFPQDHCHAECDGCCGGTARDCTQCRHVSNQRGDCIPACSRSQFVHGPSKVCKPCWLSCLTCDGASPYNCTSCHPGHTIVDGACVKTCSAGYYLDASTQECRSCDDLCQTCQLRSNMCTSCRAGFIFEEGTCRPSCPFGTYLVSITAGCRVCSPTCNGCLNHAAGCTSCAEGYVLHRHRCTRYCPKNHFVDSQRRTCRQCHRLCKTCSGPDRDQCTSCSSKRVIRNHQCHSICRDAGGSGRSALNCKFVKMAGLCSRGRWSWQCCGTCNNGDRPKVHVQLRRSERSICEGRDCPCEERSPSNQSECRRCKALRYLQHGQCVTMEECAEGTFASDSDRACKSCPEKCRKCDTATHCTACSDSYFLLGGKCYVQCPPLTYNDVKNGRCHACTSNCGLCFNAINGSCFYCTDNLDCGCTSPRGSEVDFSLLYCPRQASMYHHNFTSTTPYVITTTRLPVVVQSDLVTTRSTLRNSNETSGQASNSKSSVAVVGIASACIILLVAIVSFAMRFSRKRRLRGGQYLPLTQKGVVEPPSHSYDPLKDEMSDDQL